MTEREEKNFDTGVGAVGWFFLILSVTLFSSGVIWSIATIIAAYLERG